MKRFIKVVTFLVVVAALVAFVTKRLASSGGRLRGTLYRVSGHRPEPDVDDLTLADRVRSTLGPVEERLDLPHVHVMVEDHVALLHGDVEWPHEAATLVEATRHVSGIRDVESHLHVGLLASDMRPSEGRRRELAMHHK